MYYFTVGSVWFQHKKIYDHVCASIIERIGITVCFPYGIEMQGGVGGSHGIFRGSVFLDNTVIEHIPKFLICYKVFCYVSNGQAECGEL